MKFALPETVCERLERIEEALHYQKCILSKDGEDNADEEEDEQNGTCVEFLIKLQPKCLETR